MRSLLTLRLQLFVCFLAFAPIAVQAQSAPSSPSSERMTARPGVLVIPGPLRSLERMAGISQKASIDEVLPLLARNIYVQGYIGWQEHGRPTEFLVLLARYVNQAQELANLSDSGGNIQVTTCEQAQPLLRILGYELRGQCGQANASLVTSDQERAFLSADSGFPLAKLEESLRDNKPFKYHFPQTEVPLLFSEKDWTALAGPGRWKPTLVETLLHHPTVARLYWGLSRLDPETRDFLKNATGLPRLLKFAPEMDYYGNQLVVRSGRVLVPGGQSAEGAWSDLVGANPADASDFAIKLLAKDKGWLSAYYDCVGRIPPERQAQLMNSHHLKEYYADFRGPDALTEAARPAFRLASALLLLLNRLQWNSDGSPVIPADVATWKSIVQQKSRSRVVRQWAKKSQTWTRPEQVVDAMFAFARVEVEDTPLQVFLMFSELNSKRPADRQLQGETLRLLASRFGDYKDQYLLFSEFPDLDDSALAAFVHSADAIQKISSHTLRGNAMGTFQSEIGLWQILARQHQIPPSALNSSWQGVTKSFAAIDSPARLYLAGRDALTTLVQAAGRSRVSQDDIIELIAGPAADDKQSRNVHREIARSIRSIMEGQRLVSLDTLLTLGKGLDDMEKGGVPGTALASLAGELQEFQMPRPIFTSSERSEWAAGIYNNRHTEMQMQTDISKVFKSGATKNQVEEARGQLSPFLRDTLVGLNYAYYEPPGSQLLRSNPLFVRSHDFAGETVSGIEELWQAPQVFGQGTPAGGGAHLVGSLADLPYVLAEAEQDFITPENVQALIWREAVPGLLTNAVLPRWWDVTRNELHAVALYQRTGEELVAAAANDAQVRERIINVLAERMPPFRVSAVQDLLTQGNSKEALDLITPADSFYLTAEYRRKFSDNTAWGEAGKELDSLVQSFPSETSLERLSRDFGVPHRALAQTYSRELLNLKPFPAFSGYSSRLMAECWDSNNLYFARLADEKNYPPVTLNLLVPELTRRMTEKIFATDFEDWPALLRAMRETGLEFRSGKIALPQVITASLQ